MQWFYADQGRQIGPVEEAGLDDLVRAGLIRDDTLVWHEGMGAWQTHGIVRGRISPSAMPVTAVADAGYCGECGRPFPANELVTIGLASICATCKPIFLQRIREGGQALGTVHFAGFWIRFVAAMIDGILLGVVTSLLELPLTMFIMPRSGFNPMTNPPPLGNMTAAVLGLLGLETLINLSIQCAYEVYFIHKRGATIGKLALGLKVVRPDGSSIPLGLAFGRFFAKWLDSLTLLIGYIMAGFDDQKRALHDRICDTRVIYSK
jgi:uncharacterized RDD family membrane protein YckC